MFGIRSRCAVLLFCAALSPTPPLAQTLPAYPAKPVRVIVPTSPGSGTDNTARISARKLTENLKRSFVVENRPGAGGTIAYGLVAKAPADGYTLLTIPPSFAFANALYPDFAFDPVKDYAAISLLTKSPFFMLVHPSLPVKSPSELIALARARPGELNCGVGFAGSFTNVAMVAFAHAAKIKAVMIPYKGSGDVMINTISGEVQVSLGDVVISLPHVTSGRLRAIAVTTSDRSPIHPSVPTIAESGLPGYEATQWIGWVAPAGTPHAIVQALSDELAKAYKAPDVVKYMKDNGGAVVASTPEELKRVIVEESARWRKVIKETGMKIE